ncbi:hypothetical protein Smp_160060 [Schistosoma mansoni]|uniref:hypothetical protein n=1 Tax=Schistosoma mansoni TaxID=6183 RepID=UPI0001A624A9|nr:hypothetical protein Smp_160060 [Schistosoma mansoni]|eukprot:XP_018646756.1 hypothetical protein Smp_160060 [Schistosoma mansoni]
MSWECFDCVKDIICTQWALVALVILLFAVYVTPKVLVFVLSSFLSKFIPCILTVQRFGFIWARGVTITFINGECMYVDSIYLSSSLWNPKAKTLLSAWITGVEFHATDTGLYAIIKVMQRKGDGIRTHLNKGFMSWKIRLISFISIDISSIQIVVLSTKFLDDALYSNYKKAEDGALNNTNSNSSVCHHCLIHINDLSDVYPPIQFNRQTSFRLNKTSKLALTLRMTKLTMLFHISMRQAHVNLHLSHICGKLLCIPVFMETWLSNDLFVKNWNVIFENAYILGHLRLQLSTNISLECRNFNNATLSSLNGWFVKSVDLKLCGLRIAILEELMDLLSWKLYINQTCILTTQTSSFESTCSHCHQSTIHHQEDTLQMLEHSSFPFKNNKSCYLKQTSGNIISHNSLKPNFQCVQECLNSIKLCISFVPMQLFNFNHNHHFEQTQLQFSSSSSSLPSSVVPEMGFYFEIIRYSFERSLQFYFTSSHLSMEFNVPNSIKCSENDETLQTTSDFYTSLHSLSLPISQIIPSNLLNDNVDSKILFSHFILLNFRFCLNDLRLLNGWNSQAQHCLLDARIYLIEATEQLESSICNIYLNILHSSIFYIHDNIIEMNFYKKLSSICYLIGIWCKTLYDNSNCINNQSIMPITNIELFNCPKKNINSKQFNLMTQESLSRRKFFRFIEYLGLNTRQLNVRIYFGNVGGSRTSVRNNNINTSCTSITRHNEEFGASDSTVSDDNSGGGVIITHCKSVNCTDDFNTEQQYPDHIQIGMMERLKSRKIPQILFVLIPDLKSPGLQFGFTNSLVNLQFDFHELNLKKSFDLLNLTDLNLKLSNIHVCLLDKIHGSIFNESHTSQAPSLSLPHSYSLYSIRCNQSNAIYSLIHELPTLNNHHWDDLFYVHGIDIWNHKYQISLKFTTLQIEWPSFKMNELMNYIHWDYSNENVYQCYNNHINKLSTNRSSSIQCYFMENYLNNPIQFDGFLENINIFLINSNNSFIMLRIDSQRFIAQFRSINPIYQPLKLDSLSQITITGAKLVYSYIKKLDNGADTVSCCSSTSSASVSSNSSPCPYAIVSSCDIKNDLVLSLTEIHVDVKLPDQSLNNSSNTCDPFLVPTINNTTTNDTIELNSSNGWHLSIKPIQSYFQFYFKLLTNKHFIMVRVKNTSFQYTPKTITTTDNKISSSNDRKNREVLLTNNTNMNDDNNKNNIGCIVSSRLKVNCEHAVIMCEDQTIAVFQNLKIRQRPENIQHRTEHLKMGLLTRANPSWEFYMDLLYVTFPYRYIFRDVYQEASCVRKFLLKLHSDNITYFHVNDQTFDQSKKSSLPNEDVTLSNPTSPTSIQSSPSTFGVYSSSTARIDYIQPSTSYIKQDRIIHIKKFIIEIKDDPFECKLNDIHTILLDEFAVHEKRVNTLREQIDRAIHSGIRVTDEERQACFTRIEIQRAQDYRNRLHRFYCDYAFSDELFTFTMDNLKIKALADESITHGEQVIAQMKIMDSDSPWPNLTEQDFSTLWCRIITMNVERWRLQLRDYPKPCLNITDLFLWGKLVIAEQMADNKGQHKVVIKPGYPWPNYTLIRFSSPTKFYYDLNADLKSFHIYYGANWEPTVSWFNQRLDDIKPLIKDKSYPPLGWWDKIRLLYHGHLLFAVDTMHWSYSTSLSPYNATEFFTWQWNRTVVHWENGVIRIDGDLDIVYQTASKYDGICRLFHIPHLEMTVKLDWLSLRDPNDHHSVKYCYMDYLSPREQTQHDSFKYFRANRLAMGINFTVKPPPTGSSTMDQRPWCSFYTSVLKFADKLRNCLSQIPRPIRRGSLYKYKPPRKPHFGRLLQSLEFSINIPQLELIFWVSYAKRTGVHVNTGPIQIIGKLKCKIENEIKLNRLIGKFSASSASSSSTTVIVSVTSVTTSTTNTNTNENSNICNNNSGNTNLSPSSIKCHPIESIKNNTSINSTSTITENISADVTSTSQVVDEETLPFSDYNNNNRTTYNNINHIQTPRYNYTATSCSSNSQLTHEDLTPVHHLEIHEFKMRWTEQHRNLVYILMDSYRHAQSLKKNLSARALHGFRLHPGGNEMKEDNYDDVYLSTNLSPSSESNKSKLTFSKQIPMLAQLLEEVDTARFYAYCEEEPKQTDVVSQLQGLHICASSLVAERNWHLELINPQLMLKTNHLAGYVLVSAARAKLDALTHPPIWKDSQLLNKSSLVGHLECMQYYATVGQVSNLDCDKTPDQWLSTADVSDWTHHNLNADEDALSGRPEVVGCVTSSTSELHSNYIRPIQLQRMISRCSCEVFYIHYEPADPANLPLPHLIPPLSLDETEVVRNPEGADTVTLLHHTLNVSTNSLQYHMIVEIVNDLLLYVEPQRKAKLERNRLTFGLMSESQVRLAISRDQETLRRLIFEQRQLERYLWSYVRQTMQELGLDANNTLINHSYPSAFYHSPTTDSSNNVTSRTSDLTLKLVNCIQSARKPAEIVRRSEVCFEHARWRMTENDGQIGLADVELRGFIYTKTHRQDDSGSHRLELGWIRVCSLAPNSFYREVLAPDVSGGRYAGGPILRIACSDLAPVGGISVKEAMEISVAPIVLQMSKQFYRIMMPFFFPEKSEDTTTNNTITATPVHTATIANPTGDCISSSAFTSHPFSIPQDSVGISSGTSSNAFHYLDSNLSTNADNPQNIVLPSKSWLRRYLLRKLPHRSKNESESVPSTSSSLPQPLNFIHQSHQSDVLENISSDLSMPIVVSTVATTVTFTSSLSPSSVCIPSNNLTIEAAISGRNYCSVNDDWNALNNNATGSGTEITVASSPSLTSSSVTTSKLLQMMNMRSKLPITDYLRSQNELGFPNLFHTNEYDVKSSSSLLSPNHKSNECFAIPVTYSNYNDTTTDNFIMVMQQPTSIYLQQLLPVNNICTYCESIHSTSNNHLHSLNMSLYNPISYGSLPMDQITSVNQIATHHSKHNINNTNIPLNPVDVMQGEKQKNITDVTRFELFIPTLEYHNCVWTWLDFVMEVKTRIRKQLVREVIKKKLTPRRRLPLLRISGTNSSKNDNNSSIAASSSTDSKPHELTTSNILLSSVKRLSSLTPAVTGGRADSTMHSPDVDDDDDLVDPTTVAAQEEKAQRDLEMILGRHAQIQPNKVGKRKRFKSKPF